MVRRRKLPQRDVLDEEHVVRCCSRQKQVVSEDGTILGVTSETFSLRPNDKGYLSVALFESISGNTATRLAHICNQWDKSGFRYNRKSAVMAICNAGDIRNCGQKRGHSLRVVHEPTSLNDAYAAVRRLPRDNTDIELLEMLAAEAVTELHLIASIPLSS